MGLPRSLAFLRLGTGPQVLEVYLDPLCPFSAKQARSLAANVIPLLHKGGKYHGHLSLVTRPYPQPFHYFAMFHTEAVLVFGYAHPDLFWSYLTAVFDTQTEYFNVPVSTMTPSACRDKLTEVALSVLEKHGKLGSGPRSKAFGEFRDRLEVKQKGDYINGGNESLDDMKYLIKVGRQDGVHVTPTVLLNGLKEDSVSSSWGKEEWEQFLGDKIGA